MRVLFFAQLKDATGCESAELEARSPVDADQLWAKLIDKFPKLAVCRPAVRLAKNCEYAAAGAMFADSDEVALIPPVSGG